MKKIWTKVIVTVVVFILSLILTDVILNRGNTEVTAQMQAAGLPVISAVVGNYEVNTMFGYTDSRPEAFAKESITPIREDRRLTMVVDCFGQTVDKVAYEVRSVDGSRLVEGSEIEALDRTGDNIQFTIQLKDLTQVNREYVFVTILTLEDGRKVYYYNRFIQNENFHETEKLDFVRMFHDTTFGNSDGSEIRKYMESSSKGDNSSFHKVNINSSLKQVMWDMLPVEKAVEPIVLIRDITKDTAAIVLQYLVKEKGNPQQDYSYVEEYFRVRYTPERMYLLDYERTMDEILDVDKSSFGENKINLGIGSPEFAMAESEGGSSIAFVNANRLLVFDNEENKLSQVYSFYDGDNFDIRTRNRNFELKILKMEDSGNLAFAVSGYMNRGIHEGEVGIAVYDYDSAQNVIEERIFIPYTKSPDILNRELEQLLYLNMDGHLFFILDESLYNVNLKEMSCEIVESGLKQDCFRVSDSGRMIAWLKEKEPYGSSTLTWMNFNDGMVQSIEAGYGERIAVLGFMGEDLIYGFAKQTDIEKDISGKTLFPIYKLMIREQDGKILKSYEKENVYILECQIVENQISLKCMKKTEQGGYQEIEEEYIASNDKKEEPVNKINTVAVDIYETVVQILLKNSVQPHSLKIMTPREVIFEGGRETILNTEEKNRFYVYGSRGVELITASAAEAVKKAEEVSGSVIDESGNYIWKKDRTYTKNQIMAITGLKNDAERGSLATCLDAVLEFEGVSRKTQPLLDKGENAAQILSSNLRESCLLDLTGCSLDSVLFYNDLDIPVLAIMENEEAYLVIGFNEYNVVLMDPKSGTVYKKGKNDTAEMFEKNGSRFLTYIDFK